MSTPLDKQHQVLILGDDPDSRKTLSDSLNARGYVALAVDQGRAALAQVQSEMPAVALISLPLWDMPGPQLVAEIKRCSPSTECIVLTPHAGQASAIEAVKLGAYSYLLKPYDVEQVLITIRSAIERRETQEALRGSEDRSEGVASPTVRAMAHEGAERWLNEQQFQRQAENLAAVSKLAVKLADARPDTQLSELVAEELRSLTGALGTAVSTYDAKSQTLTVQHVALRNPLLSRVNQLLGRNVIGLPVPVSPEMLKRMLSEVVSSVQDLHEVSFGAISPSVSAAIHRALGIDHFTGLALYTGDELVGSIVIAMPQGRAPLSADMLKAFAHVVTASLRRSQAESVLRESEERYRTLVENVTIGIYRTTPSPEERFLMANPAFLRMFGFESEKELKQIRVGDVYANPAERKTFSDNLLAQGSVTGVELRLMKKDGTLMWGSVTARVVYDEETQGTVYFDCTIEDISERKGAEEQMHQNAIRSEALAEISQVLAKGGPNYHTALDTIARRTAELMADACLVSLVSDDGQWLRPVALYHPDQEAVAIMRQLLVSAPMRVGEGISGRVAQTGQPALVPVMTPDALSAAFGPEVVPELERCGMPGLLVVPLRAGSQVIGTMGLMRADPGRPLTDQDQLFLHSIADRAALAVTNARLYEEAKRRNRELELLNRVIAASASELEPEAVLETACRELALAFDVPQAAAALLNERKTEARVVAEYCAAGRPSGLSETIPVAGNASFQYLFTHKAPLAVDDAQHDPRLAPIHDLMRRRATASLLILPLMVKGEVAGSLGLDAIEPRHFSDQEISLAWSVADQVSGVLVRAQLDRERQQLEERYYQAQKMEAVGQLTAGIAHDFNNLLTAISGFTELMGLQLPPNDPLQEYVGKVLDSGKRAADLVGHLMAFARKQVLEPQVLDLNVIVSDMDRMLRRIIGEHIELMTILAPKLWPVKVDAARIQQVIVNLAVNARDAMPEGGELTIETANVVFDDDMVAGYQSIKPGNHVLLTVSDTGVGMSQEVKTHIFEPFFTTKKRGGGTGLGLATVYGIVMQSGGDIQVYSEENHGTTFKIYLPATQEAVKVHARPKTEQKLPGGKETILLVEDDVGVRDLARLMLQEQGYNVLEADNGERALRLAAGHSGSIDLLLTDVVMPGMNGVAVAERLAQTQPGLKTLFMSGYTDGAITYQNVLKPGAAFLQKPFSSLALTRKVREVLDAPRT